MAHIDSIPWLSSFWAWLGLWYGRFGGVADAGYQAAPVGGTVGFASREKWFR